MDEIVSDDCFTDLVRVISKHGMDKKCGISSQNVATALKQVLIDLNNQRLRQDEVNAEHKALMNPDA